MRTVLITGGTGLVGQEITKQLIEKDYTVHILTRSPKASNSPNIKQFRWNINNKEVDNECFKGVTDIIHLAGASIAQRWSDKAKQQIIDSRVQSAKLLLQKAQENNVTIKSYIGASASGIYKPNTGNILNEDAELGTNFLTESCLVWEEASKEFSSIATNVCINRIGIVLSKNGGALEKMLPPFKFGISSYFGNGEMYYSCIHVKDVAKQFIYCLEHNLNGTYNCSTQAVTLKNFNQLIAKALDKKVISIPAPRFAIRTVLGEMSIILTDSLQMTNQKILAAGFQPEFPTVEQTLNDILSNN